LVCRGFRRAEAVFAPRRLGVGGVGSSALEACLDLPNSRTAARIPTGTAFSIIAVRRSIVLP
jgi:hypothetical protein